MNSMERSTDEFRTPIVLSPPMFIPVDASGRKDGTSGTSELNGNYLPENEALIYGTTKVYIETRIQNETTRKNGGSHMTNGNETGYWGYDERGQKVWRSSPVIGTKEDGESIFRDRSSTAKPLRGYWRLDERGALVWYKQVRPMSTNLQSTKN